MPILSAKEIQADEELVKIVVVRSLVALLVMIPVTAHADFASEHKKKPRVKKAFELKEAELRKHFAKNDIAFPPRRLFIRIFKHEQVVEVWARGKSWKLAKTYPVCSASGDLGPKRQQGDMQVPEGFYTIDRFNAWSSYHLSLGLTYPNRSDRILGKKGNLGGDIFIHGDCVSIGCVAITDDLIREVYVLATLARSKGHRHIPVHIFPTRMDDAGMKRLTDPELQDFWANLREGYEWFETKHTLPRVRVTKAGRYRFSP